MKSAGRSFGLKSCRGSLISPQLGSRLQFLVVSPNMLRKRGENEFRKFKELLVLPDNSVIIIRFEVGCIIFPRELKKVDIIPLIGLLKNRRS